MKAFTSTIQTSSRRSAVASRQRAVSVHAMLKKPELKKPAEAPKPAEPKGKLFEDAAQEAASPSQPAAAAPVAATIAAPAGASAGVTIEYQRQRAKEMTKYFQEAKLQATVVESKVFGWTPNNEISNGRWVMFGLMVGALTEYATGVDFINQIRLIVSYFGIIDLE